MILAVFARANHPSGYGQCGGTNEYGSGHSPGTAHGYVTVIVQCENDERLERVIDRLRKYPIPGAHPENNWNGPAFDPWKRGDDWYAGPYELVWQAEIPTEKLTNVMESWTVRNMSGLPFPIDTAISYGDNRGCAYLTSGEVLFDPNVASTMGLEA